MSLFNAPSTILRLIQEAEDLKLTPDQPGELPTGDASGISDITSDLSASTPPPPAPQQPGLATMSIPNAPAAPQIQDPTLTKTVINSSIVLAHLNSLRQAIAAAENVFKKGDAGVEDASSALTALQLQISSISTVLTSFITAASANKTGTTAPVAEPVSTELPPAPVESATEPPVEDIKPNLGPVS